MLGDARQMFLGLMLVMALSISVYTLIQNGLRHAIAYVLVSFGAICMVLLYWWLRDAYFTWRRKRNRREVKPK